MPHVLPEYAYIVGFLACIIGVFIIMNVLAAINGYREK
jgi:ascorbate-specific PTS system EIIC-type component UlaA